MTCSADKDNIAARNLLSYAQIWTAAYLLLMLVGFVLWIGRGGYGSITAAKYNFFLLVNALYLGGLLVIALGGLLRGKLQPAALLTLLRPASVAQWGVLVLMLVCALSALCSDYPHIAWSGGYRREGLLTLLLYGVSFWMVSRLGIFRRCYIYAVAAVVLANVIIAVLQLWGQNPLELYPQGVNYYDGAVKYNGRFLGSVGNVDLFAALLCLLLPLLFLSARILPLWQRWLCWVCCAAGAVVLLLSDVAAGVVGLLVTVLLCLPLSLVKNSHQLRRAYVLIALLVLLSLLLLVLFGGDLQGDPGDIAAFLRGEMSGDMGSGRIAIWQQVWQLVGERPLLGGGPDTLGQRLEFFFERESGQGDIIRTKVDAAHNEYLNWLVNCGAAGLAAYLTALFATAQHVFRARHDVIALALGAAMLGYAVQAFFGISQCIVTPLFWLIWAMLECRLSEHKRVAE